MSSAEFVLVKVIASLVVPPGGVITLALLGIALFPFARRVATFVVLIAVMALYAFSTLIVADALHRSLYDYPALSLESGPPGEVIVVLGGGSGNRPLDHEGLRVAGGATLERLHYGASLHRRTGLPLLVTGGAAVAGTAPEAELMVRSLKNDFGIGVRFVESRSRHTAENAAFSAALLGEAGIKRIVLVTHATHMSRAVSAFEGQGLKVMPAPIIRGERRLSVFAFLPRAKALNSSAAALHEHIGRLWYRLRY